MDKATLIANLKTERAAWDAAIERINATWLDEPNVDGSGHSIRDLLCHVQWYEREMIGMLKARAIVGSRLWYLSPEERNTVIFASAREQSGVELLHTGPEVFRELLSEVETLTETDLIDPLHFRHMPESWIPWEVIAMNTYQHYGEHLPDILVWLDRHKAATI
jgi:hypothetical protein